MRKKYESEYKDMKEDLKGDISTLKSELKVAKSLIKKSKGGAKVKDKLDLME